MQCVILAAGLGTRMGELTRGTPKPLLVIKNETILEHDLKALPDEIDEVIIVVGHLGEKIREAVGNSFHPLPNPPHRGEGNGSPFPSLDGRGEGRVIKIKYIEQKELKGTAHALFACKDMLKDRFLVIHGDDLYAKEDLEQIVKKPLAILVWEVADKDLDSKKQAGVVMKNDEGLMTEILERLDLTIGSLVNTGAYVLNTEIFKYPLVSAGIPANEFGLPQTMMQMVKDGAKVEIVKATYWHKVTSPEDLSSPT